MSALSTLGQTQQNLLRSLLNNREGLTVENLTKKLNITRNAINQHLSSLDSSGFISNAMLSSTGGRPSKVYSLSEKGLELFPRHYALFANLLIFWIKQKLSKNELETCMMELGSQISSDFKSRVLKRKTHSDKLHEVANIMQELGYESHVEKNADDKEEIVAYNCVFHQLADECNEVCTLDLTLISNLLNTAVNHKECMIKGGNCCRFTTLG